MRCLQPKLLIFDFDGVLTDNKVYVGEDGKEMVGCWRTYGLALEAISKVGIPSFIVSRETNAVVKARATKLHIPVLQAVLNKREAVLSVAADRHVSAAQILFVGNDLNDLDAMSACGMSACPSDSHPRILKAATVVLETKGGAGVVREVAEKLLGIDIAQVLESE